MIDNNTFVNISCATDDGKRGVVIGSYNNKYKVLVLAVKLASNKSIIYEKEYTSTEISPYVESMPKDMYDNIIDTMPGSSKYFLATFDDTRNEYDIQINSDGVNFFRRGATYSSGCNTTDYVIALKNMSLLLPKTDEIILKEF